MSQLIDLGDPNLKTVVERLKPVNGYCVMVDVVGSTALKDRDVRQWVIRLGNTFNHVRAWVAPQILKVVGDMLMYWFPDTTFYSTASPLLLLRGLNELHADRADWAAPVRAAAVRCENVYEIAFLRGQPDVYGKDIDLSARLLGLAREGETVMDARFRVVVARQYEVCRDKSEFGVVSRIEGPIEAKAGELKGFPADIHYYRLPSPQ
jgi:class 3 adenylate cyclase